eukprot:8980041-Ditylum_brightwellii.AAC.1
MENEFYCPLAQLYHVPTGLWLLGHIHNVGYNSNSKSILFLITPSGRSKNDWAVVERQQIRASL